MTTEKELLALIEAVEPDNQINAKVAHYLGLYTYFYSKNDCFSIEPKDGESFYWPGYGAYTGYCSKTGKKIMPPEDLPPGDWMYKLDISDYVNDRNALKAIRPEGWRFALVEHKEDVFSVSLDKKKNDDVVVFSMLSPSETVAELHAIIQAIEWERNNDKSA